MKKFFLTLLFLSSAASAQYFFGSNTAQNLTNRQTFKNKVAVESGGTSPTSGNALATGSLYLKNDGTAWMKQYGATTSWSRLATASEVNSISLATGSTGGDFNIASAGSAYTINCPDASASSRGCLTQSNFQVFNNKIGSLNALTGSSQTFATGSTGGDLAFSSVGTTHTLNIPDASGANRGLLTQVNFQTFNNKQAGPLTGDVTTSGAAATLATVNSNVGTFTNSTITVNEKGLITAASSGSSSGYTAGTGGQILRATGSTYIADWPGANVATASGAYTIATADDIVLANATGSAFTVTLPSAVGIEGKVVTVKKTDGTYNQVTVSGTIDLHSRKFLSTLNESITLVSDGTNWKILNRTIPQFEVPYTPTFQGFGSPSSIECTLNRIGRFAQVNCKFTSGSSTADEARIGLNSLTSALAAELPSIKNCGMGISSNVNSFDLYSLMEPSATYFTVGYRNPGSVSPFTKAAGNSITGSGQTMSFTCLVPIGGWEH